MWPFWKRVLIFLLKYKSRLTIWSSNPRNEYILKGIEIDIIQSSQDMKTTNMSIKGWMDFKMWYLYTMGCYWVLKGKKHLSFLEAWINPENIKWKMARAERNVRWSHIDKECENVKLLQVDSWTVVVGGWIREKRHWLTGTKWSQNNE